MLVGKEREDWIREQYSKYRKRNRIGWIFLLVVAPGLLAVGFLLPSVDFSPTLRQPITQAVIILGLLFLFASPRISDSARKFLPPVEDRALYPLKSAFVNLKAYVGHSDEAYKTKAIEDLTKAADMLDGWNWGNLNFIRHGVGNSIAEFRKNFRGRLIPAVKNAKGTSVQSFFMSLTHIENALELGQLDESKFIAWNEWLSQFPYSPPSPSLLKRLRSKRVHLFFVFLAIFGPSVTYTLAVSVPLASRDTAFYGAIAVFGIVVSAYVGIALRQKGS